MFAARQIGWDREHIGSHVVRRNTIYDCGQNGIVGHLGCVFSTIEDNHIYNIALKREFYGYEIGGIKLHAAIDVDHPPQPHPRLLARHLAGLADPGHPGLAQPLLRQQPRPVRRGQPRPYLVDHNVFASPASLELFSQGGAFVNNLVCGTVRLEPVMDRATPYHVPHSTQVAGYAAIHGGDDRSHRQRLPRRRPDLAYGPTSRTGQRAGHGTAGYDGHPASLEEYLALHRRHHPRRPRRFIGVKQPVYIRDNVYAAGASPFDAEKGAARARRRARDRRRSSTRATRSTWRPSCPEFDDVRVGVVTGSDLDRVRFVDADFEERDGSSALLAADLVGAAKTGHDTYPVGPIAALASGTRRTRVW